MADTIQVTVPDIGDFDDVDVIEVLVAAGDTVDVDQGLITLETDKASMDVPATQAGTVVEVKVSAGDQVKQGDVILTLEPAEASEETATDENGANDEDDATDATDADEPTETSESSEATDGEPDEKSDQPTPTKAAETRQRSETKSSSAAASRATGDDPSMDPFGGPRDLDGRAPDHHANVLVLGSGPGGYTAAFRAADLGADVVLVERYESLGGVCLNVGCIPSKALLHAAHVIDAADEMTEHGVSFGPPEIDLDRLRSWKDKVVGRLTGGLAQMAKQRDVTTVHGVGTFVGPHHLEVETGEGDGGPKLVSFDRAIVAAGSRVIEIPGIPWDDPRVMDSTGALELADVPERLLVVGGGIIGLEMATVYAGLGSKVTVVELLDRLIPGADPDLVKPLAKRLGGKLEAIHLETKVEKVEAKKKALVAHFAKESGDAPEPAQFDRVLVAVGRRPNGDRIGAEAAGLTVDERGFLPTDNRMRTNVPHIFAIGDLVGQPMLAHKASHEGKVAAEVACGERSAFDARAIPSVAYTDPEVAWVGLTETDAKENGTAYEKGSFPWAASGRALGMAREEGLTKLLFDPETHRVLGGGVVGLNAGDLIAEIAHAVEMGSEAADIGLTIHPHPTLSETIAFAAEAYEGTITDLYLPKQKKAKKARTEKTSKTQEGD